MNVHQKPRAGILLEVDLSVRPESYYYYYYYYYYYCYYYYYYTTGSATTTITKPFDQCTACALMQNESKYEGLFITIAADRNFV